MIDYLVLNPLFSARMPPGPIQQHYQRIRKQMYVESDFRRQGMHPIGPRPCHRQDDKVERAPAPTFPPPMRQETQSTMWDASG